MLTTEFWSIIDDVDITDLWFQQDDNARNTAIEKINSLETKIANHIISRNSAVSWPYRSRDLTLMGYFLWKYSNAIDRIYTEPNESITALQLKISDATNWIP